MYKWARRAVILLLGLILLYGVGRFIDVYLGSFYFGVRTPYLMMPAPTAITLRWQSEQPYRGVVRYGRHPDSLVHEAEEVLADMEHELRLSGLQPDTRYYYRAGSENEAHYQGADYWFVTPPLTGQPVPVRMAVLGDPGYPNPIQNQVRDSLLDYLDAHSRTNDQSARPYLDLLLTTGDNAYTSGSNKQFQAGFFEPYAGILRNVPVWPVYGNHDARRWAFFDIFSLPQQGESGGLASGTEHYYSFDYANIHVVILDSQASDMDIGSEMLDWLARDLEQYRKNKTLNWLITVLHHPPYTRGSHNSDSRRDSHGRLFDVRENVLPMLEQAGADLVFTGHSHMYERSHLLTCHYGESDTLKASMLLSGENEEQYTKPLEPKAYQGTVYAVVGSSSKVDNGPMDHPVMAESLMEPGSMVIDIHGLQLKAVFINNEGMVLDQFTISKDKATTPRDIHSECRDTA